MGFSKISLSSRFAPKMLQTAVLFILFVIPPSVFPETQEAPGLQGMPLRQIREIKAVQEDQPQINCRSAVLYDVVSGTLLYEKNSDEIIPPASMTKLMSLHLLFNAVDAGKLSLDTLIPVSRAASFKSSPPGSSLMFLEEGQKVTLLEIMKGLAVSSGNDAGVAAAEAVSGSLAEFIRLMNSEAKKLGLEKTYFADSSGYSSKNQTTARDFARFCMIYLEKHPNALSLLHSLPDFTYPKRDNIPPGGKSTYGFITQKNNNILLGSLEGVDGLKTGYIDESGYNIALTAERNGRRLLAVTMGGEKENGIFNRAIDGAVLLSYGFYYFKTFYPLLPDMPPRKVFKGKSGRAAVTASVPAVTLPRDSSGSAENLNWRITWEGPLAAPFDKGRKAGEITLLDSVGSVIFTRPITTVSGVEKGSWIKQAFDSILLFFMGLFS
ncbi:MAG: D-alanyl-D-alanine carboxypeptidase family protein [Spirochaetia bacterium]|jgi:D-alanyl-D-alanine carboxypeptidase (penicillin-binding protein 5/6)|nr:D-alanyl-D-alanine carboxypeptidase family protein [Spirochaetia bacterium]